MFICMQKINFIIHFFLTILHFKESCNLIGRQHFGPKLETQNYARCFGEISITILVFIIDYIREKLTWQNFSKNQKKPLSWSHSGPSLPKFGPKMNFPGKKDSAGFSIFESSTILPKIRKTWWATPEKTFGRTHQKPVYFINFFVRYSQF